MDAIVGVQVAPPSVETYIPGMELSSPIPAPMNNLLVSSGSTRNASISLMMVSLKTSDQL